MNRQKMIDSCTTPKVQGAFIAAPLWIGLTLLFQNDRFAEWAWMNAVMVLCIVASIGLLIWGIHFSKEKRNDRRLFAARPGSHVRPCFPHRHL